MNRIAKQKIEQRKAAEQGAALVEAMRHQGRCKYGEDPRRCIRLDCMYYDRMHRKCRLDSSYIISNQDRGR